MVADIEISQMPQIVGEVTGNEFIPLLQGGVNKKAALSQLGIPFSQTGVTPGSYGNASNVGSFVVNNFGQITAAVNAPIAIDASAVVTGAFGVSQGGTGLTSTPTNGQILIGNGTDYTLATLTAGTNVSITNGAGTITINASETFTGTVTSVDVSGGTTGLTFTGGPITTSGTITAGGTLAVANGGTGQASYTDGQILIGKTDGSLAKTTITAGSGVSVTNGDGSITIANTAPDQVVSLTGGGTTSITGTYPNFTVTSNDQYVGTVTSVGGTGTVNGITLTGTVTSSGSLTLGGTLSGVDLSTQVTGTLPVANGGTGQTSYTDGQLLIGNSTGNTLTKATLTAGTGISVSNGSGAITITNAAPDQTVSLTAGSGISVTGTYPSFTIAASSGGGTVTSVSGTGTVNGITLTGTVTTSGSLTLGGTLSGVDLTTQVTGTLPIANGGTNATATPTAGTVAYGTGTAYAFTSAGTAGQVLLSNGSSAPAFGGVDGGTF